MHKKKFEKMLRVAIFALLLQLCLLPEVSRAHPQYQTVPTMPPPSSTPTITPTKLPQYTPTRTPLPTATHLAATGTPPHATSTFPTTPTGSPPTQTANAISTETATVVSTTPTGTLTYTQPSQTGVAVPTTGTPTVTLIIPNTLTPLPDIGSEKSNGVVNVILVGAGVLLVVLILLAIWIKRKQQKVKN